MASRLEAPDNAFIGRAPELAQLAGMIAEGARLVTIWGPGGIGKTRLALELARRTSGFVRACDLSEVRAVEGACEEIGRALGLPAGAPLSLASAALRVGRALRAERRPLVVLDNLEQLLPSITEVVTALLGEAPDARFVTTSRERLGLPGERVLALEAMRLPEDPAAALSCDAAALFGARAKEAGGAFDPAAAPPVLVDVLRALEGVPLAIEIAAANLEMLGIEGLRRRLSERRPLSGRGGSARHASMLSAIAWSWDLLTEPERRALARCAVFRGSFTLDAAERVLDPGAPDAGPASALDLLRALRDQSLLVTKAQGPVEPPRLSLLAPVRELAHDRLAASGELAEVLARHDAYFLEQGARWAESIQRTGDPEARRALAREMESLLDIHARALQSRPPAAARAVKALLAADPALSTHASAERARGLWERTFEAAAGVRLAPALRAELLGALGRSRGAAGLDELGEGPLREAVRIADRLRDPSLAGRLRLDLGVLSHRRRRLKEARAHYDAALVALKAAGDARSRSRALLNLGALAHDEQAFEDARAHYLASIAAAASVGDRRVEGIALGNLGVLEQEQGELAGARRTYARALDILAGAEDERLAAITRGNAGMLEIERGSLRAARGELEAALSALRRAGDARSEVTCLVRLALLSALEQGGGGVDRELAEARSIALRAGDGLGLLLVGVGEALADGLGGACARDEALARLSRALDAPVSGRRFRDVSEDARTLARVADRAFERLARGAAPEADLRSDALVLGPGCASFRPPRGGWCDASRRSATRRLLIRLVEEREQRPGRALSVEALQAAGWPGERMTAEAGANRVYVALAWLRREGLEPLLRRAPDGWLLDPSVPVQRVSKGPTVAGA